MNFSSSVGVVTSKADIENKSGPELVKLYNELTSESVRRFSDRSTGIARCLRAYLEWQSRNAERGVAVSAAPGQTADDAPPTPKAKKLIRPPSPPVPARRNNEVPQQLEMPRAELMKLPGREVIRVHKPSTNRGKVILAGLRPEGATMAELTAATGWTPIQVRACLRQVNVQAGLAVEEREPDRFYLTGQVRSRKKFYWPPKTEIRPHLPNTKRAKVVQMLRSETGARFEDIKAACGWDDLQGYEGVKLINAYLGYGISETDDGIIRAFTPEEWNK